MEFINIGPVYIRDETGGAWMCGGWLERLKQRSKKTQMVEFRVAMAFTCTQKRANIPLQGLDRRVLTVGGISGLKCQIGTLNWCYFTSCGFTWLEKALWRSRPVDISQWRQ